MSSSKGGYATTRRSKKPSNETPFIVELRFTPDVFGYADIFNLPQGEEGAQAPATHPYPAPKNTDETPQKKSIFKRSASTNTPAEPTARIISIDTLEEAPETGTYSPYFDTLVPSIKKADICVLLVNTGKRDINEVAALAKIRNRDISGREIFTVAAIIDPDNRFAEESPLPAMTTAIFHRKPTEQQYGDFIQAIVGKFKAKNTSPETLRHSPTFVTKSPLQKSDHSFYSRGSQKSPTPGGIWKTNDQAMEMLVTPPTSPREHCKSENVFTKKLASRTSKNDSTAITL